MFSGNRIGGMPTVKLNIIGEELSMLERGSRPLPANRLAPGPRVKSPSSRARSDAAEMRATRRPDTSLGFVDRMRGTVSKEAAFKRSGLDTDATRERLFGNAHRCPQNDRFRTTCSDHYQFYQGADEISLYTTMRKSQAEKESPNLLRPSSRGSLGMKRAATPSDAMERQNRFRSTKRDPFERTPLWETTSGVMTNQARNVEQSNYRRLRPMIQTMNPLQSALAL